MSCHQHYQPSPRSLGRKCKSSGHTRQALCDPALTLQTHLSHPDHAFLSVKPNSLSPHAVPFLHVVLTAWNGLPPPPPPPWGPLGKLLLPFKSLIWNFRYHLPPTGTNHPSLHGVEEFPGIWNMSVKTRKTPSKLGQVGHPTWPLTDRINLSL